MAVDTRFHRELKRLLDQVEIERENERVRRFRKELVHTEARQHFEDLRRDHLMPALRELMAELLRRGHQAQVDVKSAHEIKLAVQLMSRRAVSATLLCSYRPQPEPSVRFALVHNFEVRFERFLPLGEAQGRPLAEVIIGALDLLVSWAR